jgi:hypothetical protein
MWPGSYLWGYPFTAIAIAALAGALLASERDRRAGRTPPVGAIAGFGLRPAPAVAGLHPACDSVVSEIILWRLNPLPRPALLGGDDVGHSHPSLLRRCRRRRVRVRADTPVDASTFHFRVVGPDNVNHSAAPGYRMPAFSDMDLYAGERECWFPARAAVDIRRLGRTLVVG